MKYRKGFVTNSSSSSFIIVGIHKYAAESAFEKICAAVGKYDYNDWELSYGHERVKGLDFYGSYEPYILGIDADDYLRKDFTVSQIKEIFIDKIKELGLDEDCIYFIKQRICLEFGEVGDG